MPPSKLESLSQLLSGPAFLKEPLSHETGQTELLLLGTNDTEWCPKNNSRPRKCRTNPVPAISSHYRNNSPPRNLQRIKRKRSPATSPRRGQLPVVIDHAV
jgi:hypothetical protein